MEEHGIYITDHRYTFCVKTCYILPTTDTHLWKNMLYITDTYFVDEHAIYYRHHRYTYLWKNMLHITDNRYTFCGKTCYILPTTDTHLWKNMLYILPTTDTYLCVKTCYILPTTDRLFVEKHAIYYR